VEKFNMLKSKKDFQTLTKHFEMFTKQSERQKKASEPGLGKGKGKGRMGGAASDVALGGKVFEGLRFCFPPELGNTSKQKTHWDIV
jgi:DNA polymerase lambda